MDPDAPILEPKQPAWQRLGRRYLVIGGTLLIAVLAGIFMLMKGKDVPKRTPQKAAANQLAVTFGQTPFRYANNPVYDACSLLTLNTVKKYVKDYPSILASLGTDKVPDDPLTIEHAYVDRDIPAALPGDDKPRATGSGSGPKTFASLFDSHCVYGQGGESGQQLEFARVSITQKPTPLSPDLLAYLISLEAKKQVAGDFDIYPVSPEANDSFFSVILVKQDKSLAVIFRSANKNLAAAGAEEIGTRLESAPKGPLQITYPAPYAKLVNPCTLLGDTDFQLFTGKPMSALATETLYLTDINALSIAEELHPLVSGVRKCQRLETDRTINDNIAQTGVVLRQFRNVASATKYVQDLKADDLDGLTIKQAAQVEGADEAYIKVEEDPNPALPVYSFEMRIGTAIILLNVEGDILHADTSPEAFETRLSPVAKTVSQNYLRQTK